jgi:hypothetical protein
MLGLFTALSMGLLLMTSTAAPRLEFPSELGQWYETEPPEEDSEQALVARTDTEYEWAVTPGTAGPRVSLLVQGQGGPSPLPFEIKPGPAAEGLVGKRTTSRVKDGWIVSFNAGEFGAALWWFSPDGERRYKVSDDYIIGLIQTDSGLLALQGLAHGLETKGSILRIVPGASGRWVCETLLDLGHAPSVAVKDADGSLVVATAERLIRFVPASRKMEVLLDHVFWGDLYPNSMLVMPSGTIFVGMRHGVAKVEKKGKARKVTWLLPNKEFADQKYREGFK